MKTNRPHWSYSALRQYLSCPLQYFFQRVAKLPQPFTASGLAMGSAVHEALATYHRSLQQTRPAPPEAVRKVFLTAWRSRTEKETIQYKAGQNESHITDQGVALLEAYLKQPSPQNIVAVECEMLAPLHNSEGEVLEKPMATVIDLMQKDDAGHKITDLKTSSRAYSQMEAELSLQATCYANSAFENLGHLPTFEYTVLVKTKRPYVQRIATARTKVDLARLGDLVQTVDRAVEAGIFFPVETPLNCSSCPYRKPCREWSGHTGAAQATELTALGAMQEAVE
jgi:CRISPR/Cas system-associated exonuclease Cas4 (RecB family)